MKFALIMLLCSNIPGNGCKTFLPEYSNFKHYNECARYGYNYSSELMKKFNKEFIDEYKTYIVFSCNEHTQT